MSKERILRKHHGINYVMNGNTMNAMDEFAEKEAIEFTEWKDKEYPCKLFNKYGKHNSVQWFTIKELYKIYNEKIGSLV